jgi:hypothetical protein
MNQSRAQRGQTSAPQPPPVTYIPPEQYDANGFSEADFPLPDELIASGQGDLQSSTGMHCFLRGFSIFYPFPIINYGLGFSYSSVDHQTRINYIDVISWQFANGWHMVTLAAARQGAYDVGVAALYRRQPGISLWMEVVGSHAFYNTPPADPGCQQFGWIILDTYAPWYWWF